MSPLHPVMPCDTLLPVSPWASLPAPAACRRAPPATGIACRGAPWGHQVVPCSCLGRAASVPAAGGPALSGIALPPRVPPQAPCSAGLRVSPGTHCGTGSFPCRSSPRFLGCQGVSFSHGP